MVGLSPQCYIPSFVENGPPVPEKIFEGFLTIYGRGSHLGHETASCYQIFNSLYLKAFIQILVQNGTVVYEKIWFEILYVQYLGPGQEMTLTFNTHIPSYIQ